MLKFRGFHNHPLDLNLMRETNPVDIMKKKHAGGKPTTFCDNELIAGHYI